MLNNPYRRAVNIGGTVLGAAAVVATGFAAGRGLGATDIARADLPNPGLTDGTYRVESPCADLPFCPLRTLAIDVAGGQIVNIDVTYHYLNRQSQSRNTPAVRELSEAALRAQSANGLNFVSGATATSQQFATSLQAAIESAR